jgi:glyoxylase-like metal-dependent hydrolase (beta-lactamase superfamily II)
MAEVSITPLDRGVVHADTNFVLDADAVATYSDREPEHDYAAFATWSLLLDTPDGTVLWDTGPRPDAAEAWPTPLFESFAYTEVIDLPAALSAAGRSLQDVDAVVASHLHLDHAGGLRRFEGTGVPVHVHRRELPYAYFSANTDEGSIAYLAEDFDRDLNWAVVRGERARPFAGVELLHLPGHTPGLLGAVVDSDPPLVIAGDTAYVAENYAGRPMSAGLLWSTRDWQASLTRLRDREADLASEGDVELLFGHDRERFDAVASTYGD